MEEVRLSSWHEFETRVQMLRDLRKSLVLSDETSHVPQLLFRGQANAEWRLQTTLERYSTHVHRWADYFRIAVAARSEIESLAGKRWRLPDFTQMLEWTKHANSPWLSVIPGYDYLVYLRHHGFPSPLLDWSRSPYVAAFFAYRSVGIDDVTIFALLEQTGRGKTAMGGTPVIHTQGPYVTAHARHVLQQCEYTICTSYTDSEALIANHEDVFARDDKEQDVLWKFILPSTLRAQVLQRLDRYNLNAFSLFQSEEALLETAALREIVLSGRFGPSDPLLD